MLMITFVGRNPVRVYRILKLPVHWILSQNTKDECDWRNNYVIYDAQD